MEKKKILVLGATGKTGSRVIDRLEQINDIEVRKGSRNEKHQNQITLQDYLT